MTRFRQGEGQIIFQGSFAELATGLIIIE